jgi:hypothetical protein
MHPLNEFDQLAAACFSRIAATAILPRATR